MGRKKCDLFHSYAAIVSMPKACCWNDVQCYIRVELVAHEHKHMSIFKYSAAI